MPATAVLTPTTSPSPFTSAPPELPGLSAASVWITLSMMRTSLPARAGSERPSADTTPAVTEPANPWGLPIATTSWPTRSRSASPSVAGHEVATLGAHHGEVRERVAADDRERELAAVHERRAALAAAAGDHVRRRQHEAVGRQHDAAAGARPACGRGASTRVTRRFATDGASRSATPATVRE